MRRVLALFCLTLLAVLPVQASVTHTVKFGQGPVVMVWQDGASVGKGEVVTLDADAAPTLAADWIGGGVLEPVSFNEGERAEWVEIVTFASNTPVDVRLDGIASSGTVELRLVSMGPAAQYSGSRQMALDYSDASGDLILQVNARTALKAGRPVDQSLSFELIRTGEAARLPVIIETREER